MRWIVTVVSSDGGHGHVDVIDPVAAAIVIAVLTDELGPPALATVASWSGEWHCPACGTWYFEPDEPKT